MNELLQLPNINKEVPTTYFEVKDHLELFFSGKPYINYDTFEKICLEKGLSPESNGDLLWYLDVLGTVRHFDSIQTNHIQILNPEWLSGGIYKIITHEHTHKLKGVIGKEDLKIIFKPEHEDQFIYQKQHFHFLLETIKMFNLAYHDSENDKIFIPQAFSSDYPNGFDIELHKQGSIHFYFKYESFVPVALMTSFTSQVFGYVKDNIFWDKGILLTKEEIGRTQTALIVENSFANRIDIWVKGVYSRDFFVEIRSIFVNLHKRRSGLNVEEMVGLDVKNNVSVNYRVLIATRQKYSVPHCLYHCSAKRNG